MPYNNITTSNSESNQNQFNNFKNDSEYLNDINVLKEKLPAILDDFKKYYVFYNKNPTYSEYQTMFENIKANLNSINSELYKIQNSVEKNTTTISSEFKEINKLIKEEKTNNSRFKSLYDKVNNNLNGSKIMIDEYKQIYNEKYINNVFIFIGIITSGIILAKVFRNNAPINNTKY
jgi:hypothetical protein